jgi:hypothetical protein
MKKQIGMNGSCMFFIQSATIMTKIFYRAGRSTDERIGFIHVSADAIKHECRWIFRIAGKLVKSVWPVFVIE